MKNSIILTLFLSVLAISFCGCQMPGNKIASGQVVSVGKENLILKDKDEFLFVTLTKSDRAHLRSLKKGDKVTLLGKTDIGSNSAEIDEVLLDDGTHIVLGR